MRLIRFSALACMAVLLAAHALAAPLPLEPVAVKASATSADSRLDFAYDGNPGTHWVSGAFPKQWIQFDYGRPISIGRIRLLTSQDPTGQTTHVVSIGDDPAHLREVVRFSGKTKDNRWLEHSGDGTNGDRMGRARYVRITTTRSPSWVAWREIEVYQGVETLGYFGSDFEGQYVGDPAAETAAVGANLTWIRSDKPAFIDARLSAAEAVGSRSVLVLESQLFTVVQGRLTLRPKDERHALLSQVAAVVQLHPGTVAATYVLDEPYLNGSQMGRTPESLRQDLADAATDLHAFFGADTPVAAIISVAPLEFELDASYFEMFDWVGFDCYGPWTACGSPAHSMREHIDTLRSKLGPAQRMIAVPWAFRYDNQGTGLDAQAQLVDNLDHWHAEILSDGKYVAVTPFLWNTLDLNANSLPDTGARDLPWARERVEQMARQLLHPEDKRVYPTAVRASASDPLQLPFAAVDRDNSSQWNAGGPATQWIELDLGGRRPISKVQLLTAQSPAGETTHQLYGAGYDAVTGACPTELARFTPIGPAFHGDTDDNQWLGWTGSANVACLRVLSTASPSWIAWREIAVWRR